MKKILVFIFLITFFKYSNAQSLTKQEGLDALKNTLQGQILHYFFGGFCKYLASPIVRANEITINSVKYEYSHIVIEYSYSYDNGSKKNIKRIDMTKTFEMYKNGIFETVGKSDIKTGISSQYEYFCEESNLVLIFDENAKAAQVRCLKILNYLKKFAEKDPFNN